MPRREFGFCPRSSMPVLPDLNASSTTSARPEQSAPENMTGQQQQGDGVNKKKKGLNRVKWKSFPLTDTEGPTNHCWEESQSDKAFFQAMASHSHSSPGSLSPVPAGTPLPTPAPLANESEAANAEHQVDSCEKKEHKQLEEVAASAVEDKYTPPHLRKANIERAASAVENKYTPPHLRKANIERYAAEEKAAAEKSAQATEVNKASARKSTAASTQLTMAGKPKSFLAQAGQASSKPLSPPTTNSEPEKAMDPWTAWNLDQGNSQLSPSTPPLPGNKPKWCRAPKPAYKKHVWPKARDMKPLSEDYYNQDSDDNGGVNCWSDSNGDVNYDVKKLLDWEGNWLPPPEDWAERNRHTSRHWAKDMDEFLNAHPDLVRPMKIEEPAFSGRKTVGGDQAPYVPGETVPDRMAYNEIVPSYWLDTRVDQKSLLQYWKDLKRSEPWDFEVGLPDPPWWDRFQAKNSCYIFPLPVPSARVNLEDEEYPASAENLASGDDKLKALLQKRQEKHDKIMAKRNRPVPQTTFLEPPKEDRRIVSTTPFYIRPVQPADVHGIREIYNWYIENTISANEFTPRTVEQICDRINTTMSAGLPFLVAISRHTRRVDPNVGYVKEWVIGFISLDEYMGQSTLARYSFEMKLYTHHGFVQESLAKSLLDKLLEYSDTSYIARGGYTYKNDFDYLKCGRARIIKTILVNVNHESEASIEYQDKCLHDFGFKRCALLPGVGYKHGKKIDISTFHYHTSEKINAAGLPTVD